MFIDKKKSFTEISPDFHKLEKEKEGSCGATRME